MPSKRAARRLSPLSVRIRAMKPTSKNGDFARKKTVGSPCNYLLMPQGPNALEFDSDRFEWFTLNPSYARPHATQQTDRGSRNLTRVDRDLACAPPPAQNCGGFHISTGADPRSAFGSANCCGYPAKDPNTTFDS
ncbi:MAG: hypothetical protein ACI841_002584 [Planctomycetota bacterium]|jgi:hypothetical protein